MSILNLTYHGCYTPHDRTTEAIAKAVNHTWDELEKTNERVTKLANDVDLLQAIRQSQGSLITQKHDELQEARNENQQLRDELTEVKREWKAADDLLDKVGAIITAAIGCSGSGVLHDAELLVKQLGDTKQRAERAEKGGKELDNINAKHVKTIADMKYEREALQTSINTVCGENAGLKVELKASINERDKLQAIVDAALRALPVGNIATHTPDTIADRIMHLASDCAKAENERDEALARCKRYEETCADMQRQRDEVKHEYRTWLSGLTNHWIYQGDGSDYLESLNVPVLILPDALLKLTKERDDLLARVKQLEQPHAKPVGYVDPEFANRTTSDPVHCMITSEPFGPCRIPVYLHPQQQPGEVLFEGELYVSEKQVASLASGKYAAPCKGQDDITPVPVHVTIRKAGA